MKADFLKEARAISEELAALRREIHRCPEVGNREFRTAERIEAWLAGCGIPTRRLLDTAVIGVLEGGKPGRTVALRADMDALPLTEATGVDFASQNPGVMHACGHDVHVSAALGAARLLASHREALPGRVLFVFQPDEEMDGGAQRLIAAGALKGVDAMFGAHVAPELPLGSVGVRYGKFYAASAIFRVTVTGVSAHGAQREKGIDALGAAAEMVCAALKLPENWPGERSVVTVGAFEAGTTVNIIAGKAEFKGIIRTLGLDLRAAICDKLREVVADVAKRWGAEAECSITLSYPGVVNDDAMTTLARDAAARALGADKVVVIPEPTMISEDFGYYLMECPGSFYHIGVGGDYPLHSPRFLPDPEAIVVGAAAHAAVLTGFLEGE